MKHQTTQARSWVAGLVLLAVAAITSAPRAHAQIELEVEGFAPSRLARIAPAMKVQTEIGTIPGAVTLIARNGKVVHFETHGFQDAAKTRPMQKDSLFRLASMTKPVVTTVAMMLVEQGKLKLNDPLSQWLPELKDLKVETAAGDVPLTRPIWVQDVMRHTAGPGYGFGLGFGVRLDEGMGWTPGSKGDAMWAGAWGTSFWIDPKEKLVGILMAQGPSSRVQTRMLYKSLVYGALVK